jgi:hypothetical protein
MLYFSQKMFIIFSLYKSLVFNILILYNKNIKINYTHITKIINDI